MGSAPREVARPAEQQAARRMTRRQVGSDEAPAVCIGYWGARAGEIGLVLPMRVLE